MGTAFPQPMFMQPPRLALLPASMLASGRGDGSNSGGGPRASFSPPKPEAAPPAAKKATLLSAAVDLLGAGMDAAVATEKAFGRSLVQTGDPLLAYLAGLRTWLSRV